MQAVETSLESSAHGDSCSISVLCVSKLGFVACAPIVERQTTVLGRVASSAVLTALMTAPGCQKRASESTTHFASNSCDSVHAPQDSISLKLGCIWKCAVGPNLSEMTRSLALMEWRPR